MIDVSEDEDQYDDEWLIEDEDEVSRTVRRLSEIRAPPGCSNVHKQ